MEAFLIVEKQNIVIENYMDHMKNNEYFQKGFAEFRTYFSNINIGNYRGISRNVLSAIPEKFQKEFPGKEPLAQFLMNKTLEKYSNDNDDMSLIMDIKECLEIYEKIEHKGNYEIIKSVKDDYMNEEKILGFDIGYWGGDNFSIISDSMILPTWHVAPENAYYELREYSLKLNQNLLFSNIEDTKEFREYYLKQDWAETETYKGQICIQKIIS
ncbi:hypothetical protein AGMMS49579_26330 [Spirochaetia bacterium]|nr:hypothetical protein AGMMS49579_26330 [Spirochaetia bacterium]